MVIDIFVINPWESIKAFGWSNHRAQMLRSTYCLRCWTSWMNPWWETQMDGTKTAGQLSSTQKHRTYKGWGCPTPIYVNSCKRRGIFLPNLGPGRNPLKQVGIGMKGQFRGSQVPLKLLPSSSFSQNAWVPGPFLFSHLFTFHTYFALHGFPWLWVLHA